MAVKDILKYRQKGDRTEHWVREGNKQPKSYGVGVIGGNWATALGTAANTATMQMYAQQAQIAQQQWSAAPNYFMKSSSLI